MTRKELLVVRQGVSTTRLCQLQTSSGTQHSTVWQKGVHVVHGWNHSLSRLRRALLGVGGGYVPVRKRMFVSIRTDSLAFLVNLVSYGRQSNQSQDSNSSTVYLCR